MRTPDPRFWDGTRVLVTGHSGFKGAWLTSWLTAMGSTVHGISLPGAVSDPSLWDRLGIDVVSESRTDITSGGWQVDAREVDPQVVFHLAAQPLVSRGYRDPAQTFRSNVQGTVAVLELVSTLPSVQATVVVTTDKVYDVRQSTPYAEEATLGGQDPYSASKAAAELVVQSWPPSSPVATARAGNVIGGGDWAPDRLLPDLVRAWAGGNEVVLRMPGAVRPWQHVLDPLCGYLVYAEALTERAKMPPALNFGPDRSQQVAVEDIVDFAASQWRRHVPGSQPRWRVECRSDLSETNLLTLDSGLAGTALGWTGRWDWRAAVSRTVAWYAAELKGVPAAALVASDLAAFVDG